MNRGGTYYKHTGETTEWEDILIKKGITTKEEVLISKGLNPADVSACAQTCLLCGACVAAVRLVHAVFALLASHASFSLFLATVSQFLTLLQHARTHKTVRGEGGA